MAVLTVRYDDDEYAQLVSLAEARATTVSDLVRETLAALLVRPGAGSEVVDAYFPHLTPVQRYELALLHRIAGALEWSTAPGDGAMGRHRAAADIFRRGFTVEYGPQFDSLEAELSPDDARLVVDIMDMFDEFEACRDALTDDERAELGPDVGRSTRFQGFDVDDHHERQLHGYASYLLDQGRWSRLAKYFTEDNEDGHAERPVLAGYERLLDRFREVGSPAHAGTTGALLTAQQLREVAGPALGSGDRTLPS